MRLAFFVFLAVAAADYGDKDEAALLQAGLKTFSRLESRNVTVNNRTLSNTASEVVVPSAADDGVTAALDAQYNTSALELGYLGINPASP